MIDENGRVVPEKAVGSAKGASATAQNDKGFSEVREVAARSATSPSAKKRGGTTIAAAIAGLAVVAALAVVFVGGFMGPSGGDPFQTTDTPHAGIDADADDSSLQGGADDAEGAADSEADDFADKEDEVDGKPDDSNDGTSLVDPDTPVSSDGTVGADGSSGGGASLSGTVAGNSGSTGAGSSSGSASSGSSAGSANAGSSAGGSSAGSNDSASSETKPATITVSVYVDSSRAANHENGKGWPACLASATVTLEQGATVYDALLATGVAVGGSSSYVSSISGLAEFACGNGSGWLYYVNGVRPGASCGSYVLSGGESVSWIYTLEMGNDV